MHLKNSAKAVIYFDLPCSNTDFICSSFSSDKPLIDPILEWERACWLINILWFLLLCWTLRLALVTFHFTLDFDNNELFLDQLVTFREFLRLIFGNRIDLKFSKDLIPCWWLGIFLRERCNLFAFLWASNNWVLRWSNLRSFSLPKWLALFLLFDNLRGLMLAKCALLNQGSTCIPVREKWEDFLDVLCLLREFDCDVILLTQFSLEFLRLNSCRSNESFVGTFKYRVFSKDRGEIRKGTFSMLTWIEPSDMWTLFPFIYNYSYLFYVAFYVFHVTI